MSNIAKTMLVVSSCLLAIGWVAPAAAGEGPRLNSIQMIEQGWTEELPGVWTQRPASGEHRLRAQGREALTHLLSLLEAEVSKSFDRKPGAAFSNGHVDFLFAAIGDIEAILRRPRTDEPPPCEQIGTASASAASGPSCGVSASAMATIESNDETCGECEIYAATYAEGSCSPTGPRTGPESECWDMTQNGTCSSFSQSNRPFRCDAAAGAKVNCPASEFVDLAFYQDTTACQGGSPCDC